MFSSIKNGLNDLLGLVYPNICHSCGSELKGSEACLCLMCQYSLPKTDYPNTANNKMEKRLWGRVDIQEAASLYEYERGGQVQKLIHQLKYKGITDIGTFVGRQMGLQLKASPRGFKQADLIVPIPLHPAKQRSRGYNQSDYFAEGLSESLGIPWEAKALIRTQKNISQTKRSKYDRWQNVENIFKVAKPELLQGKHILLVDDVMTTGATLEAASTALLGVTGVKVSLLTMACADD